MSKIEFDKKQFRCDVATHEMRVVRDDGVHRHLTFQQRHTGVFRFDLITWPGHLCYTGDMGAYDFSRTEDMFSFFRNKTSVINPSYWGEKLIAVCRHGFEEFDLEQFRRCIIMEVDMFLEDRKALPLSEIDSLFRDIAASIFVVAEEDGEEAGVQAAMEYKYADLPGLDFADFWEYDNKKFTYHYLWCCHALVWAINRYDSEKTP